jgi:hypothetical protein
MNCNGRYISIVRNKNLSFSGVINYNFLTSTISALLSSCDKSERKRGISKRTNFLGKMGPKLSIFGESLKILENLSKNSKLKIGSPYSTIHVL